MHEEHTNKKRILFVISTLNTGGAQRAFANLSMGFSDDYECDFLLNDAENITYPYHGNIISLGLKPERDKTKLSYQLKTLWKRYVILKRLKQNGKYSACISGLTSANVANILTKCWGCKSIISIRTFTSKDRLSFIKDYISTIAIKWLYNKADAITIVSESSKLDLIKNYGVQKDKIYTIYNGYDIEKIRKLSEEELSPEEAYWFADCNKMVVTMGRLTLKKGHLYLIQAMQKVQKCMPDVKLLILGEGEFEKQLRKEALELGLQEEVVFGGFSQNPYHILNKCDLFVLPSLYEGFPNALVEAMCCGLPVISADCDSGAREILAPNTDIKEKVHKGIEEVEYGILCPVDLNIENTGKEERCETEAIAEAIIKLLGNSEKYMHYKEKSRERAAHFSMQSIIRQWKALVDKG